MSHSLGFNRSSAKKLKQEGFVEKDSSMSAITFTLSDTDKIMEEDNGCFDYPFDEITCSNDSLNFLQNIDEKKSSDCLYSHWPEIGNFDAVDMLFRSSDSTFGFEASNEYGSSCVSNDRFIPKEYLVKDHEEQFELHNKSNVNQFKVPTDEQGLSGKRSSLSGGFSDVGKVSEVSPTELFSCNVQEKTSKGLSGKRSSLSGGFSDVEKVSQVSPTELVSCNVQEISSKGSGSGGISRGASSFCQLQLVMGQLDTNTKICMKDNLYRLARGAEQRYKRVNLNGDCGDETNTNGTRGVKRKTEYTSFMGVETDKNSVDRSIAHLLFYTASKFSPVVA